MINFNFDKIYQWDQGLYLDVVTSGMVEEAGAFYVHFSKVGSCDVLSVLVEDGKAAVPNILTQTPRAFIAYAYFLNDDLEKTLVSRQFAVLARPKPPEYIYEPTPVISYPELVQLVEDLRQLQARLENVSAEAETLETGEPATAEVVMYANGLRFIFGLPRGEKGEPAVVDPTLTHAGEAADAKATGDAVRSLQQNKVSKVAGKGLSTNDFTNDAKKATTFVNEHFSSGSEAVFFESGEAEDTVITTQRDIIFRPAGSESGGVYLSNHDEDSEIMTAADVQQRIGQARYSRLYKRGGTEEYPLVSELELELMLPDDQYDRARFRLFAEDGTQGIVAEGLMFVSDTEGLVLDDGFDLQTSVLLWSNPDQAAGMENDTTVTLTRPSVGARTFKNLLVEFAMTSTSTERYTMVIPNETYTAAQRRYNAVVDYSAFNASATPRGRQIKACVKDRSLTFGSGYQGGEINNARMVPIRIFGLR